MVGQGQAAGLLLYDNYTRKWYRCTLHAQQLLHGYEVICFVFYFFICMHLFHCNRFFNSEAWGWQELCFRSVNTSSSVGTASGTVADIENEFETQLNSNLMQILHCLEIQKPLIFIRILKLKQGNFPGSSVAKTLCSPCRGLSLIPGQGSRSHMPQLKIPHAETKTRCSQINKNKTKYFLKNHSSNKIL